jgi:hypothetical protein
MESESPDHSSATMEPRRRAPAGLKYWQQPGFDWAKPRTARDFGPPDPDDLVAEVRRLSEFLQGLREDGPPFSLQSLRYFVGVIFGLMDDGDDPIRGRIVSELRRGALSNRPQGRDARVERAVNIAVAEESNVRIALQHGRVEEFSRLQVALTAATYCDPPANERFGRGNRPVYLLEQDRRICLKPGCGLVLPNRRKSGFCTEHYLEFRKDAKARSAKKARDRTKVISSAAGAPVPAVSELQQELADGMLAARDRAKAARTAH